MVEPLSEHQWNTTREDNTTIVSILSCPLSKDEIDSIYSYYQKYRNEYVSDLALKQALIDGSFSIIRSRQNAEKIPDNGQSLDDIAGKYGL